MVGRLKRRTIGKRGTCGDGAQAITRRDALDHVRAVNLDPAIGAVDGIAIECVADQRTMLGGIRHVQAIGKVHVTHVGHHDLGDVERRGVLMMMILALRRPLTLSGRPCLDRCRMSLRTIKAGALEHDGILMPYILVVV